MKKRILVCGGRDYNPNKVYKFLENKLDHLAISEIVIIQGGA
jgi:hypothetical protein